MRLMTHEERVAAGLSVRQPANDNLCDSSGEPDSHHACCADDAAAPGGKLDPSAGGSRAVQQLESVGKGQDIVKKLRRARTNEQSQIGSLGKDGVTRTCGNRKSKICGLTCDWPHCGGICERDARHVIQGPLQHVCGRCGRILNCTASSHSTLRTVVP